MTPLQAGPPLRISQMGEQALLLDPAGLVFDEGVQRRIWGLARRLGDEAWVTEAVPGMNNLLVLLSGASPTLEDATAWLQAQWAEQAPAEPTGRVLEVPVVYGGKGGGDLAEIAERTGLSAREVVARHAAGDYSVAAVGAMPGFPYLSGLDPSLACARLETPRLALAGGSVIVGGAQAGIMPYTAPSGWRTLGWTELKLFELDRQPAVLLEPGDRVRFVATDILA